jgi:histidyl-tRNA synthetase
LNEETIDVNKKLDSELKQLESLLTPVKDEQQRMKLILETERVQDTISFSQSDPDAYSVPACLP